MKQLKYKINKGTNSEATAATLIYRQEKVKNGEKLQLK